MKIMYVCEYTHIKLFFMPCILVIITLSQKSCMCSSSSLFKIIKQTWFHHTDVRTSNNIKILYILFIHVEISFKSILKTLSLVFQYMSYRYQKSYIISPISKASSKNNQQKNLTFFQPSIHPTMSTTLFSCTRENLTLQYMFTSILSTFAL